ncbi:protein TolR [Pseudooceanicola sp. CBS1P-1]|uniref:Protein TolR n=1 Tax=Pseudooceanicola albus TaxID=2692189 RepID=A0A6L7G0M4_9RHOB|nr:MULTISPECIES: protein TolR [Pseudooceanicola]MBT9382704.1 protein TolR [Pseudooceanicola endophyticus]MXN17242.1 protein TolR [Pseudooceanicola albus]
MGAGVIQKGSGGGRRNRRRGGRARPMAEINVTPFVDVMLVLLIIFMVASPMMVVGIPVELPKTQASALPSEQEEPLAVTVDAKGQISIQDTVVAEDELLDKLRAIASERKSDRVYLRADGTVPYDTVVKVMGMMSAGGFSNISLVTDSGGKGRDAAGGTK